MNINHGINSGKRDWCHVANTKVKQPRKQHGYKYNIQTEVCYQDPNSLKYYDKLVKYYHRSGGRSL